MKRQLCLLLSLLLVLSLAMPMSSYADIIKPKEQVPQPWAQSSIDALYNYKVIGDYFFSDFQENINREDFSYLAVIAYESITGKEIKVNDSIKFLDTDDDYVKKAATIGISSGISKGLYGPNVLVNREQIATMMVKTLELAGVKLTPATTKFSDDASISSYAKTAIYKAFGAKILNGSNNKVNPKGNATYQDALLIFKNIYDNYVLKDKLNARKALQMPVFSTIDQFNGTSYVLHWDQTYADYYVVSGTYEDGTQQLYTDVSGDINKVYWSEGGTEVFGFVPGEKVTFEITAVYGNKTSATYKTDALVTYEAKISEDNLEKALDDRFKTITVGNSKIDIDCFSVWDYEDSVAKVSCLIPLKSLDTYLEIERLHPEELYQAIIAMSQEIEKITGCKNRLRVACMEEASSSNVIEMPYNNIDDEIYFESEGTTYFYYALIDVYSKTKICVTWNDVVYIESK